MPRSIDEQKLIGELPEPLLKEQERYDTFYTNLRDMLSALADQPIEVDSGQWEPRIRKQINYLTDPPLTLTHPRIAITHPDRLLADVELELINGLAGLPNYMAAVKTRSGEYLVQTTPPPQGVSERAFRARVGRFTGGMVVVSGAGRVDSFRRRRGRRGLCLRSPGCPPAVLAG